LPEISKLSGVAIADVAKVDAVTKANIANINDLTLPAAGFLLDTYTGANLAFSVRRLNSLYTGACMRVREDGGDTETDIGFDSNGDLDTAAIASHCGSNSGYVTKFYGQEASGGTGSGQDLVQATLSAQPEIYDGTSVTTLNGKPALQFDGVNDVMRNTSLSSFSYNGTQFLVASNESGTFEFATDLRKSSTENYQFFLDTRSSPKRAIRYQNGTSTLFINLDTQATTSQQYLMTMSNDSGTLRGYVDGTALSGTQSIAGAMTIGSLELAGFNLSRYERIKAQEYIVFGNSQQSNRVAIETDLDSYYQIPGM